MGGSAACLPRSLRLLSLLVCVYFTPRSHRTGSAPRVRPSPPCAAAYLASADLCTPIGASLDFPSLSADVQDSWGKAPDLRPIYPPHLRPLGPGDIGLRVSVPPRPPAVASYAVRVPRAGTLPTASFPPTSLCSGCRSARGSCHQGPQRTRTSWSLPVRLSPRGYHCSLRAVVLCPAHTGRGGPAHPGRRFAVSPNRAK